MNGEIQYKNQLQIAHNAQDGAKVTKPRGWVLTNHCKKNILNCPAT
jgi:hypothetical protein